MMADEREFEEQAKRAGRISRVRTAVENAGGRLPRDRIGYEQYGRFTKAHVEAVGISVNSARTIEERFEYVEAGDPLIAGDHLNLTVYL